MKQIYSIRRLAPLIRSHFKIYKLILNSWILFWSTMDGHMTTRKEKVLMGISVNKFCMEYLNEIEMIGSSLTQVKEDFCFDQVVQ